MSKKSQSEPSAGANFLAREVCEHMVANLELMSLQPKVIMAVGGESEYAAELLKKRYLNAEITQMVTCPDQSVDLIFANLFLPWCKDWKEIFREWRRVLRPEGLLMVSSLGPDTLIELREEYANWMLPDLVDMHNLGDELKQARFADPVLDVEYLTVTYREFKTLLKELKMQHMLVVEAPEMRLLPNDGDVFSLTYEVVYGHAWGPHNLVDHVADEEGVVRIPLSHLRRRS